MHSRVHEASSHQCISSHSTKWGFFILSHIIWLKRKARILYVWERLRYRLGSFPVRQAAQATASGEEGLLKQSVSAGFYRRFLFLICRAVADIGLPASTSWRKGWEVARHMG